MNNNAKKIRLYYGIFLSVATVALGLAFASQAIGILADGNFQNHSFTREIVAKRLFPLSFVALGYILAVIAGFVLSEIFPLQSKRLIIKDDRVALKRLAARLPENSQGFENEFKIIAKERKTRKITFGVCAACCALAIILVASYAFNSNNFALATISSDLLKMLYVALPLLLFAFASALTASVMCSYSVKRELIAVKSVISKNGRSVQTPSAQAEKPTVLNKILKAVSTDKAKWIIRGGVAVCAVTFIVAGAINGGAGDVLRKAINICMECIGLG